MKVLIIRLSSIGDIVLTTPIIRCLKLQRPEIAVHYLTKQSFNSLVQFNPYIDKTHFLKEDLNILLQELKTENFDIIIDLHNNIRTFKIKRALKTISYSFPKLNLQKWILTNFKINLLPQISIVERYFKTVAHLGIINDDKGLDFFLNQQNLLQSSDIPVSHWAGYIAFVIGGSYATKKLPIAQWQKLCSLCPYPIILLGGQEDQEAGNLIAQQAPVQIYNSCGKFSLLESAELVKNAKLIVSNDTGLMHIAAAFQKTIISFWGNTSPKMGMFPYYSSSSPTIASQPVSYIFENKTLSCHPCSKLGYKKCPKGHYRCMNDLDMNKVAALVKEIIF